MSEPVETQVQTQTEVPSTTAVPSAPGTPVGNGKNVIMPVAAVGKIKQEARERGKREAMSELEKQAREAGFESLQSMFAHTRALVDGGGRNQQRQQPKQQREQQPENRQQTQNGNGNQTRQTNGNGNRSFKEEQRYQRQLERERKAREEERRVRLSETKRREKAERNAMSLEAEMALREQAILAGAKDVDYAVTLLKRSIEGKTEKELEGFDEVKFFGDLREKSPYLFGEVVKPVTTGTGGKGNDPVPPTPGDVTRTTATNGQVDANKMKDGEFREHMRKRGLEMPTV